MTNKEILHNILLIIACLLGIVSNIVFWVSVLFVLQGIVFDNTNIEYWIKLWLLPSAIITFLANNLIDYHSKILNIKTDE